jgi:preprotein translocase subunit SecB
MAVDDEKKAAVFHFDQIYLKDASFESPRCPQVFSEPNYNPEVNYDLRWENQVVDPVRGTFEVVLKIMLTATTGGQTDFLVDLHQAGVFIITGLDDQQLERVLDTACLSALFPFLREHVNRLVTSGGFKSLLLPPVNFEALYEQKKASGDSGSASKGAAH